MADAKTVSEARPSSPRHRTVIDHCFPQRGQPHPPRRSDDCKDRFVQHQPPRRPPAEPTPGSDARALMDADVVPSEADRRALAAASPDRKLGKRKKLSARKDVQELIAGMDHAACGPLCLTAAVPACILELNEEYKDLFPGQMPPELPPASIQRFVACQDEGTSDVSISCTADAPFPSGEG